MGNGVYLRNKFNYRKTPKRISRSRQPIRRVFFTLKSPCYEGNALKAKQEARQKPVIKVNRQFIAQVIPIPKITRKRRQSMQRRMAVKLFINIKCINRFTPPRLYPTAAIPSSLFHGRTRTNGRRARYYNHGAVRCKYSLGHTYDYKSSQKA